MSKKLTFGKLAGTIFCIIATAAAVVLMFANAYYGGQMKLIDKCFTPPAVFSHKRKIKPENFRAFAVIINRQVIKDGTENNNYLRRTFGYEKDIEKHRSFIGNSCKCFNGK